MELKDLVALYRRWIWLLILGLVLGLIGGAVASKLQTPTYEASTKLLVARNRQQGSADLLGLSDQQLVLTYQALLKTRPVMKAAASKLGVQINPDKVTANVIPDTQIIQIKVQDETPANTVAIANALVQSLIEQNETMQVGSYTSYEEGLNSQIAQVQKQIGDLQSQISEIDQAIIQEQLAQVNQQISDLAGQISALQEDIATSPEPNSDVEIAALSEKQSEVLQLRSLLSAYQQIQTNLTFIGSPVQGGTGREDPRTATLQSTLNLYQQLYLNMLNNLEAVKLARVQSTPTVTQIEVAALPKIPVRPIPLLYTVLGAVVGLSLAAGAVLLISYFDDSFHTVQKVQEMLKVPVIGEIGETDLGKRKWYKRRAHIEQESTDWGDAFGSLRMNLLRIMGRRSIKTILISSAWPGEGKTTISANLARSFAHSGKRVILLDADLTHPQIHSKFGIEKHLGLTDILSRNVAWQKTSCTQDGVTMITGGSGIGGANGLLESDRMTDLLEQLRKKADIVIVDGPPLFTLNAQILASKLGGVVLVIRQGQTKVDIARSVRDRLELMEAPLLGVVMNRVPRTARHYYYGYVGNVLVQEPEKKRASAGAIPERSVHETLEAEPGAEMQVGKTEQAEAVTDGLGEQGEEAGPIGEEPVEKTLNTAAVAASSGAEAEKAGPAVDKQDKKTLKPVPAAERPGRRISKAPPRLGRTSRED
jgi:tyrosine-protein kinase Etk/Wzc